MNFAAILKKLPEQPGVYLMKDAAGTIIYVGKAGSLRKRVASYFSKHGASPKQAALVAAISDIDFVQTGSEAEALILESGLIKEHQPKYNVAIRDDKAYPLLKVTIREQFPRLLIARRRKDDGNRYFGPYTSARLLRQAVKLLRRLFPLRTCRVMPATVCLNYHLRQCPGPCAAAVDETIYRQTVERLILFLEGRKLALINRLAEEMAQASVAQDFERAIVLRDQLESLSLLPQRQMRSRTADQVDALQRILRLKHRPSRIEGYDISNISGAEAVGSLVCFREGLPDRAHYRRFKIKSVPVIDDYAMLAEVLTRRFSGSLADELEIPDLIIIDGGRGHLHTAEQALRRLKIPLPLVSIAKRFEHLYVQWQQAPLALPRGDKALHLLMRVRDEAHRFALGYHRLLRKRRMLASELDQIPGVGPKRKAIILRILAEAGKIGLSADYLRERGLDERTATAIMQRWQAQTI